MGNESQISPGAPLPQGGAKTELIARAKTVSGDAAWVFVHHRDPDVILAVIENEELSIVQRIRFLERRDLNARVFNRIRSLDHWWKSQAVRVAVAKNPKTPLAIMHPLLRSLGSLHLCDVANSPYVTRDAQVIIERTLQDRLKVMPLGQRVTLARKTTPVVLQAMLKGGPHRFIVEAALGNPRLTEQVLEVVLATGEWEPRALDLVLKHPDWGARYEIRRALFRNRALDVSVRRELAVELTRQDLVEMVRIHHRDHTMIRIVTIEFERRGYPDTQIRGLYQKPPPPKAGGPRGMSFDELQAMLEADIRNAGGDDTVSADRDSGEEPVTEENFGGSDGESENPDDDPWM